MSIHNYYNILSPPLGSGIKKLFLGSYAEVRKGVHKTLGVMRAIKIISKSEATSEEINRVLHEAEILKKIVKIF